MSRNAQAYRRVAVESASPVRVLDELYARLLLDCDRAKQAIVEKRIADKGMAISHGLQIVDELAAAVDVKVAPELGSNLLRLYDFCRERLVFANLKLDTNALEEASNIIAILRQAFAEATGEGRAP